jgi:hypothetical protein
MLHFNNLNSNNMKTLKYYLLVFVFFGTLSCEKLLEEPVFSFRDGETVLETPESINALARAMYKKQTEYNYFSSQYHQLLGWNSGIMTRRAGGDADIAALKQTPQAIWVEEVYQSIYAAIVPCNFFLLISKGNDSEYTQFVRGEAYFMRAMNYFNLVRLWGTVPIVLDGDEGGNVPRAESIDVVYNQIISDLQTAINLLPDVREEDIDKPIKMTAHSLMAKVYAQLGSMMEDPDMFELSADANKREYWQKAKDHADTVIKFGPYSLNPDYAGLFDLNNEYNQESIFEISFSNISNETGSAFPHYFVPQRSGWTVTGNGGGWGRLVCSREMYDTIEAVTEGIDARLLANLTYDYVRIDGQTGVSYPALNEGTFDNYVVYPTIQKYKDPNSFDRRNSENNYYYLRYAEILLIYAEAANELFGPTPEAISPVNELLARSRNSNGLLIPKDIVAGQYKTVEEFRARIMTERYAELMGESHEWYDARRRGRAYFKGICENHNRRLDQAVTEGIFESSSDFYFETDDNSIRRNIFLPIPQAEMDANQEVVQNFGY